MLTIVPRGIHTFIWCKNKLGSHLIYDTRKSLNCFYRTKSIIDLHDNKSIIWVSFIKIGPSSKCQPYLSFNEYSILLVGNLRRNRTSSTAHIVFLSARTLLTAAGFAVAMMVTMMFGFPKTGKEQRQVTLQSSHYTVWPEKIINQF